MAKKRAKERAAKSLQNATSLSSSRSSSAEATTAAGSNPVRSLSRRIIDVAFALKLDVEIFDQLLPANMESKDEVLRFCEDSIKNERGVETIVAELVSLRATVPATSAQTQRDKCAAAAEARMNSSA